MKDVWTKAAAGFSEFFVAVRKKTLERGREVGITDEEFGEAIQNKHVLDQVADTVIQHTFKRRPKLLKLIPPPIPIPLRSAPFSKDSFFGDGGPVKLWFSLNFTNWILP